MWTGDDLRPALGTHSHFSVRPTMEGSRASVGQITSIIGLSESIPQKRKRQAMEVYIDMPPQKVGKAQNLANGKERRTIIQPNEDVEMVHYL